jgi:hypothetical protein
MATGVFGGVAGGNISPCRFIKLGSGPGIVVQATAGDPIYGISGSGTHTAALAGLDDGYCAVSGENCPHYSDPGTICLLEAGASFSEGALLKSDANGKGIAVASTGDAYGAVALDAASAAGQWIPVKIQFGHN